MTIAFADPATSASSSHHTLDHSLLTKQDLRLSAHSTLSITVSWRSRTCVSQLTSRSRLQSPDEAGPASRSSQHTLDHSLLTKQDLRLSAHSTLSITVSWRSRTCVSQLTARSRSQFPEEAGPASPSSHHGLDHSLLTKQDPGLHAWVLTTFIYECCLWPITEKFQSEILIIRK